jgi:hypothetical protein
MEYGAECVPDHLYAELHAAMDAELAADRSAELARA